MVRQRSATPLSPVQIWVAPLEALDEESRAFLYLEGTNECYRKQGGKVFAKDNDKREGQCYNPYNDGEKRSMGPLFCAEKSGEGIWEKLVFCKQALEADRTARNNFGVDEVEIVE